MELKEFARTVVLGETLEAKLAPPPRGLTDREPGLPLRIPAPGRPATLAIVPSRLARVPARKGMVDPAQRKRIVHALANHELQAVELFAWALLAFPGADRRFRAGLLERLREEQAHTRMYLARLKALGTRLGDYPVSGYFWSKVKDWKTPLFFVCGMCLTFENANLDHTLDYAEAARAAGDARTAALLERVHQDEIEHVRFGWSWLSEWKEARHSHGEAYAAHVTWPLRAALARGKVFRAESRAAAGLDPQFIRLLAEAEKR
jgi:uncharacterized ferritin-like protein (DUF455 family)